MTAATLSLTKAVISRRQVQVKDIASRVRESHAQSRVIARESALFARELTLQNLRSIAKATALMLPMVVLLSLVLLATHANVQAFMGLVSKMIPLAAFFLIAQPVLAILYRRPSNDEI